MTIVPWLEEVIVVDFREELRRVSAKWLFLGKDRFGKDKEVRSTLMISFFLFCFFLNIQRLCYRFLHYLKQWENLNKLYRSDDAQQLFEKKMAYRILLSSRADMKILKPKQFHEFIVRYGKGRLSFRLCISIRIMLSLDVIVSRCQRSFSKLKLILSWSSMTFPTE